MNNAGDRPYHRFLLGLADVSLSSFEIVLGVGAFLLTLPVVLGLAFWLLVWPLSEFIEKQCDGRHLPVALSVPFVPVAGLERLGMVKYGAHVRAGICKRAPTALGP